MKIGNIERIVEAIHPDSLRASGIHRCPFCGTEALEIRPDGEHAHCRKEDREYYARDFLGFFQALRNSGKLPTLKPNPEPHKVVRFPGEGGESRPEAKSGKKSAPAQAELLLDCAADAELFHSPDDGRYAVVPVNGRRETWSIRSRGFRDWLCRRFYERCRKAPSAQAMQDCLGVLGAKARYEGEERETFIRVGVSNGKIYIDLADSAWRVIEIDSTGWKVIDRSPLMFRRAPGMLSLPEPVRGGSAKDLRPFVNAGDDAFRLIVAWLVHAISPRGPYPVLVIEGEQGSGKSQVARMLRSLVDPATAPLRTLPRDERDLAIAANNSWLLAFDNLSGLSKDMSDALCKVATGSGFATRQLYTDAEETIFSFIRPVLLNGIDRVCSRGDLLSRSIVVTLSYIPDAKRRPEAELRTRFEAVRPRILGALLDAVSTALRRLPDTKLDRLPRMADFAKWVAAAEASLPWKAGEFMRAYAGNQFEAVATAVEFDPAAVAIREFMNDRELWKGRAKELLDALESVTDERMRKLGKWPKSAESVGRRLRRIAPLLRGIGIIVTDGKDSDGVRGRFIRLEKEAQKLSQPSQKDSTIYNNCDLPATVESLEPSRNCRNGSKPSHELSQSTLWNC